MKKLISIILALFIMLVPMAGCKEENDNKATLTLNHSSLNLPLFGEADLIASYENVSEITWENSNEEFVKIVEYGNYVKITAIKSGRSIITVSGGDKTAQCVVVVGESDYVLSVTIDRVGDVEIQQNASLYVPATATYMGQAVEGATISYSIEDENIATVSADGVVTGVSGGETTLNVVAEYNGMRSTVSSVKVSVRAGAALVLSSTYINLYEKDSTVSQAYYPNKNDFNVYIVDNGSKVWNISYTIDNSNDAVATYVDGTIVSKSAGNTMFTVTCEYNGQTYVGYLYVNVKAIPTVEITLSETEVLLYTDVVDEAVYPTTTTLTSRIKIDGRAITDKVTWGIEAGNSAATVNNKGIVKALGAGKAIISGSYTYNGKTYKETCEIEVIEDLFYGTFKVNANAETGYDMAYAYLNSNYGLLIENVDLTNTADSDLIRFSLPNYIGEASKIFRLFFRVTDVNDENNWVEYIFSLYRNGQTTEIVAYAVNTSTWTLPSNVVGLAAPSETSLNYMTATSNRTYCWSGTEAGKTYRIGTSFSDTLFKFGKTFTDSDYTKYMMGFSIVDDEVYCNYISSASSPNWQRVSKSVFSKELQQTLIAGETPFVTTDQTSYPNPVWNGFTANNVEKVNVKIRAQMTSGAICPIVIDTVGGATVTANSIANMSIVKN